MKRRLVLAIVLVATMSVVLFAVPLGLLVQRAYRDEELLRLQRDAVATTRLVDARTVGRDPVELPGGPIAYAVYDTGGRRVGGRGPARADALVRDALRSGKAAAIQRDGRLLAVAPLLGGEHVAGVLLASRSSSALTDRTHDTWLQLLLLAAGVLVIAALAALWLAGRLTVPLTRLAGAAKRLGDGDFSARAPRSGVPELDAVGEALDATAERLDDLVTRERSFSADASHQLRTPLAALRIELEALELRGERGPELDAALHEVDRLQETIDALLALARDAPRGTGTTDLANAAADAAAAWRGPLAERSRPLRVLVRAADPTARASSGSVRQILDVLLSNACEHGGGEVVVTVRESGDFLAVDVHDEGPGVADAAEVFRRRSPSADGHGIGLSLASSLAHAEGGGLALRAPGRAPTFTLTLARGGDEHNLAAT
ncbi:MAG: HAMP domain-containing histidine kinase [Actinobacteria bacterium]|nr:MAG: HAMP domain-containing histidine kinase [Actinomycetota bacterium]